MLSLKEEREKEKEKEKRDMVKTWSHWTDQ